jgi:hypothetical protein
VDFIPNFLGQIFHQRSKFLSRSLKATEENDFILNIRIHLGAFAKYAE